MKNDGFFLYSPLKTFERLNLNEFLLLLLFPTKCKRCEEQRSYKRNLCFELLFVCHVFSLLFIYAIRFLSGVFSSQIFQVVENFLCPFFSTRIFFLYFWVECLPFFHIVSVLFFLIFFYSGQWWRLWWFWCTISVLHFIVSRKHGYLMFVQYTSKTRAKVPLENKIISILQHIFILFIYSAQILVCLCFAQFPSTNENKQKFLKVGHFKFLSNLLCLNRK